MKRTFAAVVMVALAGIVGCGAGTSGGPGKGTSRIGQPDDTFNLTVPTFSTKIKQEEAKVVTIGIKRGKNFNQDVSMKFEGRPQGVTIDPAAPAIKHGEDEAKVTLKAAKDAALGDFTIKVIGHPATGSDAKNELKITVQKK